MEAKINKDMIINDILDLDEDAGSILMESGMHCLGCIAASGETLEEACQVHGIDCNKLVDDLNNYFNNKK